MSWFEGRVVDFAPKARYGSAICSLDEKRAFVIGGRHTSEFYDDVWVLHNTERFSWSSVEVTSKVNPPPVAFATVNCANERVYLFGGLRENGECEGEMWSAQVGGADDTLKTLQWEVLKGPKGPSTRYGHSCNQVGDKLVYFGGAKGGEFFNDVYYFEIDTNTWKKPTCSGIPPAGRCYHSATLIENQLYIFGGLGKNQIFADVYMFDMGTDSWTKIMLPGAPKGRFGHTATALGSSIIMCGGRTMPSKPTEDNSQDGGDLIDSFASGIPVLDTEKRGWAPNPFGDNFESEDVAHHSAIGFSTTKVIFVFGLKLAIKKSGRRLNPQLEVINRHRILYHLNTVSLQYCPDGSTPHGKPEKMPTVTKRKSQFLFSQKKAKSEHSSPREKRWSTLSEQQRVPPSPARKSMMLGEGGEEKGGKRGKEEKREEKAKKKEEKKEKKRGEKGESPAPGGSIGMPYNIVHRAHVDSDFNWKGGKAEEMFEMQEKLGKGAFATVYKGQHNESGFILAIKDIEDIDDDEELKKEIDILKACKHPNIVCYYGTCNSASSLWILMDYCGMGSVRDMIETREKVLQDDEIQYILQKSLKGLSYLHMKGIIHRDIKAANILMTKDGEIKLADFGVSEQLSGAISSDEVAGSPHWMAPEVVLGTDYDARCDIWSMGVTAIEMAEGLPPKAKMNPIMAMKSVPKDPPPTLTDESKHIPEFKTFLEACLVKDPAQRPNAVDTLMNPFVMAPTTHEVLRATVTEMLKIKKAKQQEKERKMEEQKIKKLEEEEERRKERERRMIERRKGGDSSDILTRPPLPFTRNLSTDSPTPPPLPPPASRSAHNLGTFVSSDNLGTFVSNDSGSSSLGTFVASDDNFGTFVSKDSDSDNFGTFVAKNDDNDNQFGTFVAKNDDSDNQFGTFVAKNDDNDNFGTFVAKNDDNDNQFGTFVAKGEEEGGDYGGEFGTFVAKKEEEGGDYGGEFGTFVAKKEEEGEEYGGEFGTFVAKKEEEGEYGGEFGTFVAKKEEEGEEKKEEDEGESNYFGTFVFKADDPETFATVRRKEKSSRPALDMSGAPLPPPPPPLPPILPPRDEDPDPSTLPENSDDFDFDKSKVLVVELRQEIRELKDKLRLETAKNLIFQ